MPQESNSVENYLGIVQPRGFPPLPSDWVSEAETIETRDGTRLFAVLHHLKPADWKSSRALIVFHGLGEHGGRYLHFPHFLKNVVDAVYCVDYRGHGRSEGLRGHVENFSVFVDETISAVMHLDEKLKARFGRSEIHLFAHSMGAMIALQALVHDPGMPLRSANLSSPLLGIRAEVPLAKKAAALVLSRVWGSLQLFSELNPEELSHDRHVVEAYTADRLVHRKVTPKFFSGMTSSMAKARRIRGGIMVPTQFLLPTGDRIVDSVAVKDFFKRLHHSKKELKVYPELFHEATNEIGKEKVFEDIAKWIAMHNAVS